MKKSVVSLCSAVVFGGLLLGCGTTPPPPPPQPIQPAAQVSPLKREFNDPSAPAWVRKGCGASFGDKKKLVCGVGIVSGMTNPGLARSAAEARGRTAIARSLSARCKSMLKDFQSTVRGGPGNKVSDEQYVTDTSKQVTDRTLVGSRLEDTWVSDAGTTYALIVLDLETFRNQVKEMNQLDEQIRRAIVERADKSFEELDEATEGAASSESVEQ